MYEYAYRVAASRNNEVRPAFLLSIDGILRRSAGGKSTLGVDLSVIGVNGTYTFTLSRFCGDKDKRSRGGGGVVPLSIALIYLK